MENIKNVMEKEETKKYIDRFVAAAEGIREKYRENARWKLEDELIEKVDEMDEFVAKQLIHDMIKINTTSFLADCLMEFTVDALELPKDNAYVKKIRNALWRNMYDSAKWLDRFKCNGKISEEEERLLISESVAQDISWVDEGDFSWTPIISWAVSLYSGYAKKSVYVPVFDFVHETLYDEEVKKAVDEKREAKKELNESGCGSNDCGSCPGYGECSEGPDVLSLAIDDLKAEVEKLDADLQKSTSYGII